MKFENDPEGTRLPVKLDTTTNGEFAPIPLAKVHHHANHLALEAAANNARRLGIDRRSLYRRLHGGETVPTPAPAPVGADPPNER